MTREEFKRRHGDDWKKLERLLAKMDGAARRMRADKYVELYGDCDLGEFDRLYRLVCKHLALARQRLYGTDLVDYLNGLALQAHHRFYGERKGFAADALSFAASGFPRLIRRHRGPVLVATLMFVVPSLVMGLAVGLAPDLTEVVLGPVDTRNMEEMYDPESDYRTRGRESASDVEMFGYYIANNVGIGFQTFAGGILFGVGSAFFLTFNGVFLGTVAAHLTRIGYGSTFYPFIAGHSAFELTAIVLAGAAGLNIGWALLAPGRLRRVTALRDAAGRSVRIIYGVAVMLFLAAIIEAFWSSSRSIPDPVKYAVGAGLWLLTLSYFLFAGRRHGS
jgi:uncharacterized membrane protein SpoIIM required for sporulation